MFDRIGRYELKSRFICALEMVTYGGELYFSTYAAPMMSNSGLFRFVARVIRASGIVSYNKFDVDVYRVVEHCANRSAGYAVTHWNCASLSYDELSIEITTEEIF
jgi:hypothetical protein